MAKGMSLAQVSRATKIKEQSLQRLEDGLFEELPAAVAEEFAGSNRAGDDPEENIRIVAFGEYFPVRGDMADSAAPADATVSFVGAAAGRQASRSWGGAA